MRPTSLCVYLCDNPAPPTDLNLATIMHHVSILRLPNVTRFPQFFQSFFNFWGIGCAPEQPANLHRRLRAIAKKATVPRARIAAQTTLATLFWQRRGGIFSRFFA